MKVEVFNTTQTKYLPQKKLAEMAKHVLVSEKKNFDINVILTGKNKIQTINRRFRGQDKPTDVLSFPPEESEEPPPFQPLGEIYICVPVASRQARKAGHSLHHELLFLAIHGALHLCGYTHETNRKFDLMMSKSNNYFESMRI